MKMKMKSKFLGLSAKLAMALFVFCGTTLTGCYSENDDVAIPYVESDPIYTITGIAMDPSGKPVSGVEVSVSSSTAVAVAGTKAVANITTTGANGMYSISSENDAYGKRINNGVTPNKGSNTVKFSKDGKTVEFTVTLAEAGEGGASIGTQNVVIGADFNLPEIPGFKMTMGEVVKKVKTYTSAEDPNLDIVNSNDMKQDYSLNIMIKQGSVYEITVEDAFASAPADVKADLIAYAKTNIGNVNEVEDASYMYNFDLPARSYLMSLTATGFATPYQYDITYAGVTYTVKLTNYGSYVFSREYGSWDHSHGHGHGHGHGEDYNAGGGIVEGLN